MVDLLARQVGSKWVSRRVGGLVLHLARYTFSADVTGYPRYLVTPLFSRPARGHPGVRPAGGTIDLRSS